MTVGRGGRRDFRELAADGERRGYPRLIQKRLPARIERKGPFGSVPATPKTAGQMLKYAAKKVYYYGPRYECSVCGSRTRLRKTFSFNFPVLSELDVIGGEYRVNDNCPVCFSGARERLLHAFLRKSGLARAPRVLNVAPERGIYESLFRNHPGYVAIDIDPQRYDYIPNIRHGDLTRLKFADRSFDLVICSHVLEHIPDDALAMREIARVLAPRGKAILQVPLAMKLEKTIEDPSVTDVKERERRFGQFDHVRIYGPDYFDRLRTAGLEVAFVSAAEAIAPQSVEALQINPRERIFLASPSGLSRTPTLLHADQRRSAEHDDEHQQRFVLPV